MWPRGSDQSEIVPVQILCGDIPSAAVWYQDESAILHQIIKAAVPDVRDLAGCLDINERREIMRSHEILVRQMLFHFESPFTSAEARSTVNGRTRA
jgi:hypothetical protein